MPDNATQRGFSPVFPKKARLPLTVIESEMIAKPQDEHFAARRICAIASAILALLGIPGYCFCASHLCVGGHMQHPPYAAWHYVVDIAWAALFAVAAVLAVLSNLQRKVVFVLLLVPLIVSRLYLESGGAIFTVLFELPATIVVAVIAISALRKNERDTASIQQTDIQSRQCHRGSNVTNRTDPFKQDSTGRTALFHAAENGDIEEVRRIIFSLAGTGVCCQRLGMISKKDSSGLTAADVAEQAGHKEIADLLRGEQIRMEYYE